MDLEEFKPVRPYKTLSTLTHQEFTLLITSHDPTAVEWRRLHKMEFEISLKASDLLNDFFKRNTDS
jgi:hypothetical protein